MKTIQLSSGIRQNTLAAKALGHAGKDFRIGTYIDVTDNLPNILRALDILFNELDYYTYDLIQLRAKQTPESKHEMHLMGTVPKKASKTLIYKAQADTKVVDDVVGFILKRMHPCRNCGNFIPLPKKFNKEGGFYKNDSYCRNCIGIIAL